MTLTASISQSQLKDSTKLPTKYENCENKGKRWLRGKDLNQRPSGYEPDELPDCSTPRQRLN